LKYRSCGRWHLTAARDPGPGPCMAGSLTGAVASQRVTEARDGGLRLVGNQQRRKSAIVIRWSHVDGPSLNG
jgi:hypothetical protein